MKRLATGALWGALMLILAACGRSEVDESMLPTRVPTIAAEAFAITPPPAPTATPEPTEAPTAAPTPAPTSAEADLGATEEITGAQALLTGEGVTETEAATATETATETTTPEATADETATEAPAATEPAEATEEATATGTVTTTEAGEGAGSLLPTPTPTPAARAAAEETPESTITPGAAAGTAGETEGDTEGEPEEATTPEAEGTAPVEGTPEAGAITQPQATATSAGAEQEAGETGETGEGSGAVPASFLAALENADPQRGQTLTLSNACIGCHSLSPDIPMAGPTWHNMAETAATRVAGQSAEEYLYTSIVHPNEYVVEGYLPNVMIQTYGQTLAEQDIADIVAYLLTLEGE